MFCTLKPLESRSKRLLYRWLVAIVYSIPFLILFLVISSLLKTHKFCSPHHFCFEISTILIGFWLQNDFDPANGSNAGHTIDIVVFKNVLCEMADPVEFEQESVRTSPQSHYHLHCWESNNDWTFCINGVRIIIEFEQSMTEPTTWYIEIQINAKVV